MRRRAHDGRARRLVPVRLDAPVRPTFWRSLGIGLSALVLVLGIGTLGYWLLGLDPFDAFYQTVITVSTVGFHEPTPLTTASKAFTIFVILAGVSTALYVFGIGLEAVIEGHLTDLVGRRRMERRISELHDHVILCGWGRVGRSVAQNLAGADVGFVVLDSDPDRVQTIPHLAVLGDATDDAVLDQAGIERARALVAATSDDATNLYLTLSGRTRRPDLMIVARAREAGSEAKLLRAGADRVINPQAIGGARIAALLLEPHVAEFVDVVTREHGLEFRLAEAPVASGSALDGASLRDARIRERTGALVLALRDPGGGFATNPPPDAVLAADQVLIAIGTAAELDSLIALAGT